MEESECKNSLQLIQRFLQHTFGGTLHILEAWMVGKFNLARPPLNYFQMHQMGDKNKLLEKPQETVKPHNLRLISCVSWNCRGFLYAQNYCSSNYFSSIDLIFLAETWEKDGIGTEKNCSYSHFSIAQDGSSNVHSSTTIYRHEVIVVFIRMSICTWVSHLPSSHTNTNIWIR